MKIDLNKTNFDAEVITSGKPYLVDFWAPWCGPCKIIGPILEQLAVEYEGKISIGKVNVDEESELGQRYNIMSIPTLKFFKDGKIIHESLGASPKEVLEADIKRYLL